MAAAVACEVILPDEHHSCLPEQLERPLSAARRPSLRQQRLRPLHAGVAGPLNVQLESVVEALLYARSQADDDDDLVRGLTTVEEVCSALQAEPSLAWAVPHALECLKLLRERAAPQAHPPQAGRCGRSSRHGPARHSHALAGRLCGSAGRLPPMGGGGPGCAVMLARSSSAKQTAMPQATALKLAGVDENIAVALAERLQGLSLQREGLGAWLLVETCRDCARHSTTFRHEEKAYLSRYLRLKKHIEHFFPAELAVDILVPQDGVEEPGSRSSGTPNGQHLAKPTHNSPARVPPLRIGSFEVYLCCPRPLVPFSSVSLPALHSQTHRAEGEHGNDAAATFSAVCISSKLQTLAWPVAEDISRRLVKAMPRVPLRVSVHTGAGLPVPGVLLEAIPTELFDSSDRPEGEAADFRSSVMVRGITDKRGVCKLSVPFCVPLSLHAGHELLMAPQERKVTITSTSAAEAFVTETVKQLWQVEEAKELVVFCSSPRESLAPPKEDCKPFQGRLLGSHLGELRPNAEGYVRGDHDLLCGVSMVACSGWRSVHCAQAAQRFQMNHTMEVARLGAPLVKVSLVSPCCGFSMPNARVSINKEDFGETGATGSPVVCSVKCGKHQLQVRHLLAPETLQSPLTVSSAAPCGVQVKLSPHRLRFVCVQDTMSTDLWIVGGKVAEWRRSSGGPPRDADVWLWDGELRGPLAVQAYDNFSRKNGLLAVNAGLLQGNVSNTRSDCWLSQALALPKSMPDCQWQVAWHPKLPEDSCIMGLIADAEQHQPPARWVARLARKPDAAPEEVGDAVQPLQLRLRTLCCGRGVSEARVTVHGHIQLPLDEAGCADLPCAPETERAVIPIKIDSVPQSLLPGGTSEFFAHHGRLESTCVQLDLSCQFWLYWILPEDDEDDDDNGDEPQPYPTGLLSLAVDPEHVPEEARAVSGTVRCPGAKTAELSLDGSIMGPFPLQLEGGGGAGEAGQCLLANLAFEVQAPPGFAFRANEPSPLRERCGELGGCELQRLFRCPVAVGTLEPLPPPRPYRLALRSGCCGCGLDDAAVVVDGRPLAHHMGRAGCFRLPRRKLGDPSGSLRVQVEGVHPCLLPGGSPEHRATYGPSEPRCREVQASCLLWVYWVPPEEVDSPEAEGEEDEPPPEGLLWVSCSAEQVPDEARPVTGKLLCIGAEAEEITLHSGSMGPFNLSPSEGLPELEQPGAVPCLLSHLTFEMVPPEGLLPEGFSFLARDPSPLAERVAELGGCELQRLMQCPVAVGTFRANPLPPLGLSLRTSCCGCGFGGARVAVNGREAEPLDDRGHVQLTRRRKGGVLELAFGDVPPFLLPGGVSTSFARYGPLEPASVELEVSCMIWVYWIPPDDGEDMDMDNDEEMGFPDGLLWVACDKEHVPDEGMPVIGRLECPGAAGNEIILDGSSMGPFSLRRPSGSKSDGADTCILSRLSFRMESPPGFDFQAKSPSPLAERCTEVGGCEMQRLQQCPVVVGTFKSLPPVPPLRLALRSSCCGRGFAEAQVRVNGQIAVPIRETGFFRLPRRKREERSGDLQIQVCKVPSCLLPGGVCESVATFGRYEPMCLDSDISCLLWVYWVPPEEEDGDAEEEAEPEPLDGLLWVAAQLSQVPDEAKPVRGVLECPQSLRGRIELDGGSLGPFELRVPPDVLEQDAGGLEACLLARLSFHMEAPEFFEFHPREPSPLAERCEELGGCELQRLAQCPTAVGTFKPLPLPPLQLALCTACCRRPYAGAQLGVNGRDPALLDDSGLLAVQRRRKASALRVSVDSVPPFLLAGGERETLVQVGPLEPRSVTLKVLCPLWIYWVPPDEEEGLDGQDDAGELPAPEGTLWVACDADQVSDEARPVKGLVECPGTVEARLVLDGRSMGPFHLHMSDLAEGSSEGPAPCVLSWLSICIAREDGFEYRAKSPSPLAERCEELGGCELQRLVHCPVVMGFLRAIPNRV